MPIIPSIHHNSSSIPSTELWIHRSHQQKVTRLSRSLAPTRGLTIPTLWFPIWNLRRSYQQKAHDVLDRSHQQKVPWRPGSLAPTKGLAILIVRTNKRSHDPYIMIPYMESTSSYQQKASRRIPSIPPTKGFPTVWIDPTNKRLPDSAQHNMIPYMESPSIPPTKGFPTVSSL